MPQSCEEVAAVVEVDVEYEDVLVRIDATEAAVKVWDGFHNTTCKVQAMNQMTYEPVEIKVARSEAVMYLRMTVGVKLFLDISKQHPIAMTNHRFVLREARGDFTYEALATQLELDADKMAHLASEKTKAAIARRSEDMRAAHERDVAEMRAAHERMRAVHEGDHHQIRLQAEETLDGVEDDGPVEVEEEHSGDEADDVEELDAEGVERDAGMRASGNRIARRSRGQGESGGVCRWGLATPTDCAHSPRRSLL